MYQFSRSIYRELADQVADGAGAAASLNRQRLLEASEAAVERLARDRHYFARPARSLFNEVRIYFPMTSQLRVYRVIERYLQLATVYVEQHAEAGISLDGRPLVCHASTRRGTPCRRVPLPGAKYCPSHQHLEERFPRRVAA